MSDLPVKQVQFVYFYGASFAPNFPLAVPETLVGADPLWISSDQTRTLNGRTGKISYASGYHDYGDNRRLFLTRCASSGILLPDEITFAGQPLVLGAILVNWFDYQTKSLCWSQS